jgi:PAS domain S-box-containing protein
LTPVKTGAARRANAKLRHRIRAIPVTRNTESLILLGGVLLLLFFAANVVLNASNIERLGTQAQWVARTHAVTAALEKTLSDLKDAETGQRGYIITGEARYLEPYDTAVAGLDSELSVIAALTADSPAQQAALQALRRPLQAKLAELDTTIRLRRERGFDAARRVVETDAGKVEMDRARAVVGEMIARETTLLKERQTDADRAYRQALGSAWIGGLASCAIIVAYLVLLRHFLRARDRSARAIAEQHELLQTTLASIGDGVITTDRDGRVTFLNAIAESLTGWSHAEARGVALTRVFIIVNEATRAPVENPAMRALKEGVVVGLANHTVLISKDGSERPIDDSAAPIRVRDEIFGCVLVFRDVTERARLDAELRNADRRKDEFLATLAHELRNPLAPISNALFVLGHEGATLAAAQSARATMQRQVKQMVRLIDDLLDVSRIRLGKLALSVRRVPLSEVVEQAVETVAPMIGAAQHRLDIALPAEPVYLDADPIRLAQIFSNLLNNSAKFTPRGGRIGLTATLEGSVVAVSVKDNGLGIDQRHLEEIFGLFSQVDQSLERAHGGLGIGLSLVRRLAELHGGTVTARSDGPGRGSEFVVRLPRSQEGPALADAAHDTLGEAAGGRRILVVDDNRDGAESLATMIRLIGHEARVACDSASGLAIAADWRPDVAFLDIGLPGMNGYDLCLAMRAAPWGRGLSIVALTGWGQEQDRRRAEESGFDHHVVKPIGAAELGAICGAARRVEGRS